MSIKKCVIGLVFCVVLFSFFVPRCLVSIGRYLVHDDVPSNVDIILVLSGGKGSRVSRAVELYHEGYASQLLMTGSPVYFHRSVPDFMKDYAVHLGVPSDAVLLEKESLSTLDHMLNLKKWVRDYQWKKVMVVTSGFHTKRAHRVFSKGWKDVDVKVITVAADDNINYSQWYKHYEMIERVLSEWTRVIIYFFRV